MTSFVDCPEAGKSFHNKRAGIGGKNQLFQPPTGAENCCSQVQQIRLSFSIPQYFTVIFFPALNHDECGGIGKPMHATHLVKEHIPTFLICYLTARPYILPYMGHVGMCRCEGYGFQAGYSKIGYINQSVWV